MKVLSPVGKFSVDLKGMRVKDGKPVIDVSMGAWSSEVSLERRDVKYVIIALAGLLSMFLLGCIIGRTKKSN